MPRVRRIGTVACAILASLLSPIYRARLHAQTTTQELPIEALRSGFRNPPPQARLRCYWWWLNGNTDKQTITHDLEEMKAKGFGGALLVDANGSNQNGNDDVPAGPKFGSAAWIELYRHALSEADRLGLEITLNITSGWNLGGPEVPPEQASKLLTWSRVQVQGGTPVSVRLDQPSTKNGFYRDIAVLAYPLHNGSRLSPAGHANSLPALSAATENGFSMPDGDYMLTPDAAKADSPADTELKEIRNVSANMASDGTLSWTPPTGSWEILRIGYTDSGARVSTSSDSWQGLAIDYMSPEAFNTYWNNTVEPLLTVAKPFHSLKYLASDSWELGGTNWTDSFAAEFKTRRGYDPIPWLPVAAGRVIDGRDQSLRFLADLRRTIGDLIVSNHYDLFAQHAAEHGLGVQAESGGPHGAPIDALETFRRSAVPQTEFWSQNPHRARDEERFFTKEAASAANIYGQRIVAQEGETSIGPQWSESLASNLKPSFDMAITEGMNRLVWHEFTSSPANSGLPGQEYFAGTHLNPKVTWWDAGRDFFAYLNRVQFLMQQGLPVHDVLYFYGDNVPGFVRDKADDPAHVLPGYDYDVTDEDALLHTIDLKDNLLTGPSGMRWRVLVLPKSRRLSLASLQSIAAFVRGGATVIGLPPLSATGILPADQTTTFGTTVREVWGGNCESGDTHGYGSGKVVCTADARSALQALHIAPDVELREPGQALSATSDSALDFVHSKVGLTDIYFFRNASSSESNHQIVIRSDQKVLEQWDAVTGTMYSVTDAHETADGRTQVPLKLPPYGSAFLVFTDTHSTLPALPNLRLEDEVTPANGWHVNFESGRGAPDRGIRMSSLTSWTESSQPGIRYFSGTATYQAIVSAPKHKPSQEVFLQFTDVREIARVTINGHDAGTVWAPPLNLRVDQWLKPSQNTLEIAVTNLWPNRIIGDLQPGATHRFTHTNIKSYAADSSLPPSGLIGPLHWMVGE